MVTDCCWVWYRNTSSAVLCLQSLRYWHSNAYFLFHVPHYVIHYWQIFAGGENWCHQSYFLNLGICRIDTHFRAFTSKILHLCNVACCGKRYCERRRGIYDEKIHAEVFFTPSVNFRVAWNTDYSFAVVNPARGTTNSIFV